MVAASFAQDLVIFVGRWFHLLAGITWIGLLYYFNFVQGPAFAAFEAGPRTEATRILVPRALWWFRWGALATWVTGVIILGAQEQFDGDYFETLSGMSIFAGVLMATVMFANVWLVIWPAQQRVIANAERTAAGQEADPEVPGLARKALIASRTNTLFSIPVMFFMVFTSHFAVTGSDTFEFTPGGGARAVWYLLTIALVAIIELNALGYLGGIEAGKPGVQYLEKHRDTIVAGFVLWAVYFVLLLILAT